MGQQGYWHLPESQLQPHLSILLSNDFAESSRVRVATRSAWFPLDVVCLCKQSPRSLLKSGFIGGSSGDFWHCRKHYELAPPELLRMGSKLLPGAFKNSWI